MRLAWKRYPSSQRSVPQQNKREMGGIERGREQGGGGREKKREIECEREREEEERAREP